MGALPTSLLSRQDLLLWQKGDLCWLIGNGRRNGMETVEKIWKVVEPYLAAERLELDDLELIGRGNARTLRVTIDRNDGVDLDLISEVSRGLSRLLDSDADLAADLSESYQLEVSSPGLERKLSRPSHFHKSIGREVVVKTGSGSVRGVISEAGEDAFTVVETESHVIPYSTVLSARTVFRWERAPKPGHAKPGNAKPGNAKPGNAKPGSGGGRK